MRNSDAERAIRDLASRQHATISRRQALDLGLGRGAIQARVQNGSWVRTERGVYAAASSPGTWEQRVVSAVLSGGENAAASHLTAAALWHLIDGRPGTIDITVPHHRRLATRPLRNVHRSRADPEVRTVFGISVTSPARTVVDLAAQLDEPRLEAVLDAALERRLVSVIGLRRHVQRHGLANRRGMKQLSRLLLDRANGTPGSELERNFLRLVRRAGLPAPARQHRVRRRRIDFAYVDEKIAIELDGFAHHGRKSVFDDDRRRQNLLVLDGWLVLRFTWHDVTKKPEGVVAILRQALRDRARGGI